MKKGIAASGGYAIGTIVLKNSIEFCIIEKPIESIESELKRFKKAVNSSKQQIKHIKAKAIATIGKDKAEVFESHLMLLDDPEFSGAIEDEIRNKSINSEKAVKNILDNYLAIFEAMDDEYIRERVADIKDVAMRLLSTLCGSFSDDFRDLSPNSIIVAADLTPSDTAELDKDKVIAFLTNVGGRTSHSAIMARSLEIPAIVGLNDITYYVKDGDLAIVDGEEGIVLINPKEDIILEYKKKKEEYEKERDNLRKLISVEPITYKGKTVEVAANIGNPEDVNKVIENGGDGIGLFRTEFLYMNKNSMPTEEEQLNSYKYVLERMNGKPVVIRTLDIGGDKKLPYLSLPEEANPFLGFRAIRLCLKRRDIFKIQLRALLRASVYGNLKIMFPMISGKEEIIEAKALLEECRREVISEGYKVNSFEVGIMVEVPAAAIISEELAKEVDFLSIGTNDLIQYTLAADRMNENTSYLYDPGHPAVLSLIKMTVAGAHKSGKWCGMCGEMAGDQKYISILLDYGLDELSMSAPSILKVKKAILDMDKS